MEAWLSASDHQELKEAVLRDERVLALTLLANGPAGSLIGRALREVEMPEGTLIALVNREAEAIIPRGSTVLEEGDRLTVIGEPAGLKILGRRYKRRTAESVSATDGSSEP